LKGRPHFVESTDPIPSGKTYTAICGAEIKDSYFSFQWDVEFMGKLVLREEKICPKCLKTMAGRLEPGKKYLYGALPGAEIKQYEGDSA
jgi:hypothetical protein